MRLSIAKAYESIGELHKPLFALIEMKCLEESIVRETSTISERTEHQRAKEILGRRNVGSEGYRNGCQRVIGKMKEHTSNE